MIILDPMLKICYHKNMSYTCEACDHNEKYCAMEVPASKSIFNRAALLAALAAGDTLLQSGALCDDSLTFLHALCAFGVSCEVTQGGILVHGGLPLSRKKVEIDVRDSGTAARFLSMLAAFRGGEYRFIGSEQISRRPMQHLSLLQDCGVLFRFEREEWHLPFSMYSDGINRNAFSLPTDVSTQYASGLLMAALCNRSSFFLQLSGTRTGGSYIAMTLRLMQDFGVQIRTEGEQILVCGTLRSPASYRVEADLSSACYLYALAFLLRDHILVKDVTLSTMQSDKKFLTLLASRGMRFEEREQGLYGDARGVGAFEGFCEDMSDFSDQVLTAAALAPYAATPTVLSHLAHIRNQECDRLHAICRNLTALGVPVEERADGVTIFPAPIRPARIKTYGDHRVAMAFALLQAKQEGVVIDDPSCCKKTFPQYFDILHRLMNNR